jgi:hypothetical protein
LASAKAKELLTALNAVKMEQTFHRRTYRLDESNEGFGYLMPNTLQTPKMLGTKETILIPLV